MAEVILKSVCKKYGDVEAVKDLSLECHDGEFLVLLGPSGAGKTSILKMISGLETITAGEIFIGGQKVNALEPRQRRVAMVFENYALYPHLTVYENIASPLKAAKMAQNELDAKVRNIAEMLEVSHLLDRRPSQLSGGQQQRVSFGRALVKDALVYLMDEPLSHLDAKLRHQMRSELMRIHADVGVTTLYVTHDFSEALALADRIVVINKGVVQQVGTPDEIYDEPANEFVADLVGEPPMNLLNCQLATDGEALCFLGDGFRIPVPERLLSAASAIKNPSAVRIGIRPTQVTVYTAEHPSAHARGEVYVVEPLGGISVVTVMFGHNLLKVRVKRELGVDIGDYVCLQFDNEKLRVFDSVSGRRVA
jgi:multiple sugar transport system ATP-binding protein